MTAVHEDLSIVTANYLFEDINHMSLVNLSVLNAEVGAVIANCL